VDDWSRDFESESNAVSRTSTAIVRERWAWRAQVISFMLLSNVSSGLADGQTDAGRACQTRRPHAFPCLHPPALHYRAACECTCTLLGVVGSI